MTVDETLPSERDDGMAKEHECPHCGTPLGQEIVAKFMNQSVVQWRLFPAPGELLDIGTVGGTLTQMRNLLRAIGKENGIPTEVLLRKAVTDDDGTVTFDFLVCRYEDAEERRARMAKRRRDQK